MIIKSWNILEANLQSAITLVDFIDNNFAKTNEISRAAIYSSVTELISNIKQHAYPPNFKPTLPTECEIILAETKEGDISVTVIDHGITIPQSILNKLSKEVGNDLNETSLPDGELINIAIYPTETTYRGKGLSSITDLVSNETFQSLRITSRNGTFFYSSHSGPHFSEISETTSGTMVEFTTHLKKSTSPDERKENIEISIAEDFSLYPAGRSKAEGPYSAQSLADDILIPSLHQYSVLTIILDGTYGYGSSFLEEAFGGLVRKGYSALELKGRLNLISNENLHLTHEIWQYINEAKHGNK